MDVVDEWGRKASVSSTGESITPFFSNPTESQLLFSSPSLSPPILHRVPHLTHARFLTVSGGIPPSSSSAIESSFRIPHPNNEAARVLSYNRLQFLPLPCKDSVLVFFPTGTNLDQLGFVVISSCDGIQVMGLDKGEVFVAKERFFSRILKISVQPVSDLRLVCKSLMGYVMVCLLYSVHWYCVKYDEARGRPVLSYIGCQKFKSCSVANASWSPQLTGECLVLLENGEAFLFELNENHCSGFRGCKMKVSWEDHQGKSWLGCEFGWRLGTFIVARSDAVFVITRSSGSCCSVRALLESESLNMDGTEEFVAFAKAGIDDSFRFILASKSYVYLCDQRSGVPLLKWQHDVEKPCFIDVYSLSDLGFQTDESTTSCLVIGSFWSAESQMFCYGPANDSSSLYVWELPHNLLSPAGKCLCGDCEIREVIMKESLPVWIDWQKNRVLVLGFGVLNKYLPSLSSSSDGFTLIRLKSSGKLEAVKFHTSPDPLNSLEAVSHIHRDSTCKSEEVNLLYHPDDNLYKLPRRFKYLELDYLSAYTKGNLSKFLESMMSKKRSSGAKKNNPLSLTYHEELCEKLKLCGFGRDRSSSTVTAVFNSINSPTSVFDIALRETWSSLPMELLLLAFSNYSDVEGVLLDKKKPSLEFLSVPELPQLPPFLLRKPSRRSSKWSKKVQPGVDLIGPVLPLQVLLTLHELRNGGLNSEQQEFSPDAEFSDRCNQISKAAREMANSGADERTIISLDDDMWLNNDSQKEKKRFIAYSPITKTDDDSDKEHEEELTKFVSKVRRKDSDVDDVGGGRSGLEVFNDMSPVEICFEEREASFDMKALFMCKALLSQWQDRSTPYQDFLSQYHLHK
ncbi:unnamed protein product [Eruca vesicaria subsp. sativa]|uniref:Uncharacterized protein n=1 Tax=Eruca vesicaria subsp. sativa TaxID=29727 RepID=A0ABC8IUY5_ERUVS|nr:unnamed protein product [Eruca vesicaria subsp. sativa]